MPCHAMPCQAKPCKAVNEEISTQLVCKQTMTYARFLLYNLEPIHLASKCSFSKSSLSFKFCSKSQNRISSMCLCNQFPVLLFFFLFSILKASPFVFEIFIGLWVFFTFPNISVTCYAFFMMPNSTPWWWVLKMLSC